MKTLAGALLLVAPLAQAAPPKVAVVVVVDQMRADYLTRFSAEYKGGLARLAREGAVFTNARHGHVPTETAPGHAALLTGCFPAESGIVGNQWWDRREDAVTYSVGDPRDGRSPTNLHCDTVGDALKRLRKDALVVSVSGKDRAAILMAGKHPDIVAWYDKDVDQFVASPYYYKAKESRLPSRISAWRPRTDPRIPDDLDDDDIRLADAFDALTLDVAKRLAETKGLGGSGSASELLVVSLSSTDLIGHKYGPDSEQVHRHLLALDASLGEFLDYLDARVGRAGYTLVLSADHGVAPLPSDDERLNPKALKEQTEQALDKRLGPPPPARPWVLEIEPPHVYLNTKLADERKIERKLLRDEARRALAAEKKVAHVFTPEELTTGTASEAPFIEIFRRSYHPERSGDLLLLPREGVIFTDRPKGTEHGTPYDYDSRVPLVFVGYGVRPGQYEKDVLAEDLAPTLARVLEVPFPVPKGVRVLDEALSGQ
jgi:predicted AlkP superfamily pyrophosphatase or phosphodiesterase